MRRVIVSVLVVAIWAGLAFSAARAGEGGQAVTETPTPTLTNTPPPTVTAVPSPVPPADTPAPVAADPVITKRVDLERAVVGDRVTFTVTVLNPNDIAVPDVSVFDPLPALVDYLDATTTAGTLSYDASARAVTVLIGTLAPRQEVTIVIQTRVNALGQPPDAVSNLATLNFTNGNGQSVTAQAAAGFQLVPAIMPSSGFGPGPREQALLWMVLGLAAGGLVGGAAWAFGRRR